MFWQCVGEVWKHWGTVAGHRTVLIAQKDIREVHRDCWLYSEQHGLKDVENRALRTGVLCVKL